MSRYLSPTHHHPPPYLTTCKPSNFSNPIAEVFKPASLIYSRDIPHFQIFRKKPIKVSALLLKKPFSVARHSRQATPTSKRR